MKNEGRRHSRVAVEVDVDVSVQISKKHSGHVTDISEAGLFVETSNHVEEGSFVVIKFTGHKIMFGATVRRVAVNGFGAEFGSMNEAHREVISRFVPTPKQAKVSSVVQMPTVMLLCDEGSHSILAHELKEAELAFLEVRSIDKVISSMDRFDVICVVSDYIVSGKDTFTILREIKEQKQRPNFPVVMYSGRYDVPYKKFEELGIQCFSKSNTSPRSLVRHIKRGLSENNK
ncbi:MAG: PilZ domain-containing protein [Dissulfurispiraceae bacterium]|jgi:CheY-like chemotaxis protein